MSKRILAMLLTLALVLSCVPTVIVAEEAQQEVHKCEHCDATPEWVDWDGTGALEDGKHYRLTAEKLTLSAPIALNAGTYVLCLNGNTISGATAGRIFDLSGTASLTIVDHTAEGTGEAYTAGKLTDATNSAVYVKGDASFTLYDGIMENNKRPSGKDGGCIYLEGKGSVQLKGGLYRNNFARYGAVVYMVGNRANQLRVNLLLENAYITGNTSTHTGAIQGDGLSTILVKDTVITGNSTTGTLTGGLYLASAEGELTLSGKVIIDGNTNKTADSVNRNVVLNNAAAKLNLDGITEGSRIQLKASSTDPKVAITTTENQKSWNCGWITLGNDSVSWTDTNTDGIVQASELQAGHYHDGVKYTAVTGNTAIPTTGGNFYLTQDVSRTAVTAFGKDTNLCLNGHNIINTGTGRAIQITKNTTTVLTIEDCSAYTDAQGVYHAGAITGTNMTSSGTVYVNAGTTLKLQGGKISGNTAAGAAGVYNAGTFYMYGGEISDNKATSGTSGRHGGGVYNAGTFVMEGGMIKNNEAGNYGGGVFSNKAATITGGIITGNKAVQGGGVGLYNNNQFTIGAVTISENTATAEGGGLWAANSANVTLTDTVITGNTVTGTDKGGGGVAARDKAKITMVSGQISKNQAPNSQGGGLFAVTEDTELIIQGGLISENTAKFGGGALLSTKAKLTLKGGTIEKNAATAQGGGVYVSTGTTFAMEGGAVTGNTAKRLGGGIYNLNSTTAVSGGSIENNTSEEGGGGIALTGTSTLELQGGKITGNTAPASGGIHTTETTTLNISGNPQVIGNSAESLASNLVLAGDSLLMNVGAMTEGAMVSISGTPYRAVSAPVTTDYSEFFGSDSTMFAVKYVEGALYLDLAVEHNHCLCVGAEAAGCDHGKVKFIPWESTTSLPKSGNYYLMNDVTVSAQTRLENTELNLCLNGHTVKVAETGRVYYLADQAKLSITDCAGGGKLTGATLGAILSNGGGKAMELNLYAGAIADNHSAEHGGAVIIQGDTVFNMYGGEISGNSVAEGKYGGAMYAGTGAIFNLYGGKISENAATNSGAVYINRGSANLLGGEISGNTATKDGGAVYVTKGQVLLNGSAVRGNTAANGAGIMVAEEGILTVKGGQISANRAENGTGGGILGTGAGATVTIEGGTISENAAKFGGGVLIQSKASLTMKGGLIEKNTTSAQGGGVYVSTNTVFTMEGGKIAGNTAKRLGGGIYNLNSTTAVSGGSIENNTSEEGGGGIALTGTSTLELQGGKITGNTAPASGGIHTTETTTLNISGNPQVMGNTAAEKASNLCLAGDQLLMNVGTMTEGAKIGISGVPFRAISTPVATDYSNLFISDSTLYAVKYVEGALYLDVAVEHNHCLCTGVAAKGCDHSQLKFAPWESTTSLPTSGNYYLTEDVEVSAQTRLENTTLNLCLNGHTVKVAETGRVYYLAGNAKLSITDCAGGGKLTGATTGAILSNGGGKAMELNLYAGSITENHSADHGGAVIIQSETVFNMYGGEVSGNSVAEGKYGGAMYVGTGATFNMYGGKISENAATNSGAIYLNRGSANLLGGEISGNTATKDGGAVYVTKGQVLLNGSAVKGNTASNGAGIMAAEEGILTVKDGKITGNKAENGNGGGILGTGAGATVIIEGGAISENAAKFGGGVLIMSKASLTMKEGTIEKNTTSAQGGGVYISTNTTFTMEGGKIAGNTAKRNGGGIYNLNSTSIITGGSMEGNRSEENGGGIAISGASQLKITNATVSGNTAKSNGGGIAVIGSTQKNEAGETVPVIAAAELLEGAVITGNATDASGTGGGVFVKGEESYALVDGATVSKNTAKYGAGMLCQTKSYIKIKSGKVTGNKSTSNGGGLYISTNTTLYMEGGEVSGNSSQLNGGGAYFLNSNLKMSGGKFSNNTATKDGGGMYLQLSNTEFTGGSVTGNSAKNSGGMRITGGKHRISGLSVSYNTAESDGGGIQIGRQMVKENGVNVDKMPDFVVSSITMVGNKAKSGGALLLLSKGAEYTIRNAYIADNNASSGGGAIYVSTGTTLHMSDSTVTKNYGRTGGAIQHLSSAGYYENVEISENTGNNAAAMNVTKNADTKGVHMKNVKLINNVGAASGAMVVQGDGSWFTAEDCEFIGNSTPKTGGAIFVTTKAKAQIKNTLFKDNSAGADAGAVMLGLNSLLEMDGCTYTGNHAENNGGGIYNRGEMYISNAKVENNTCGYNGAGIGSGKTGSTHTGDNCGLFLTNVVSSGNVANNHGGGLFVSLGCHCVAENLTLTDNTAKVNGGGVWAQEDFIVNNLTATGNIAECGAVYLAKSYYDGQSYFCGVMSFKGLLQVKDNAGGGVFVGEGTTLTLEGEGMTEGSYLDVTLHSGALGQKVFGVYNYEGENPTYVLTPGDRSVTDPELPEIVPEPEQTETQPNQTETQAAAAEEGQDNTGLYLGIGGIGAVIVIAAAALVIVKKKKSAKAETKE